MARVTIEDCLKTTGGHFDVAKLASRRAHQLEMGAEALIERDGDKSTVVALREIAENLVDEKLLAAGQDDGLMEIEIAGITQYEETPAEGAAESAKDTSQANVQTNAQANVQADAPAAPAAEQEPIKESQDTVAASVETATPATPETTEASESATPEKAEASESAESTEQPMMSLGDQIEDEDVGATVADVDAHSEFHEDSPEAEQTLAVEASSLASEEEPLLEVPGTEQEQDAPLDASLGADNAFDADEASDASDPSKTD